MFQFHPFFLLLNPPRFVAGADVFSRQSDGATIAAQYAREGINLRVANTADALRYLVATKEREIVGKRLRGL